MIQFLYKLGYDDKINEGDYSHIPETHAQMFTLGERLGITSLKYTAKEKLKKYLKDQSYAHQRLGFKSEELEAFVRTLNIVWSTTPHDCKMMRDAILDFVPENLEGLLDMPAFEEFVEQTPSFAMNWMRRDQQYNGRRSFRKLRSCKLHPTGGW